MQFGPAWMRGQNKEEALCFVPGPVIGEAMPEIGIRAASEACGRKIRAFCDDSRQRNEANGTLEEGRSTQEAWKNAGHNKKASQRLLNDSLARLFFFDVLFLDRCIVLQLPATRDKMVGRSQ